MKIRLSGVHPESIVDGPGLRYVIFVQGCPHHCKACHNPSTHCFSGGTLRDTWELVDEIFANPLLKGVTFSGGEPFEQARALSEIAGEIRAFCSSERCRGKRPLDIWCYTGYEYEELAASPDPDKRALLALSDVLIDGKFVLEKKSMEKPFVGSANQRVIDLASSSPGKVFQL